MMKHVRALVSCALIGFGLVSVTAASEPSSPYRMTVTSSGTLTIERDGKRAEYRPVFTVIRATTDPKVGLSGFTSTPGEHHEGVNAENYPLPRWQAATGKGTTDVVYEAGAVTELRAT